MSKFIAVDFDGTIVTHDFPEIGEEVPMAIDVLKQLKTDGNFIILYTMRSDEKLMEAVKYCMSKGFTPDAINENPLQKSWTNSPKVFAHIYIDDAAIGCPLMVGKHRRPFVDWYKVKDLLPKNTILTEGKE